MLISPLDLIGVYYRMSLQEEFDDEFVDIAMPTHSTSTNKFKRIGIEVDVTSIKGELCLDFVSQNSTIIGWELTVHFR